ncbi:hypothetical protein TELCIR_09999 [Teladorsagia circumcincta]|uniref:Uncharacterized protein n=1 Tax=Teladorsagia circumcincta TaxID=45464 RepID=A0A2G9UD92_TELCI|nr:hypothetical protein TELCIR_09999 [Teladorsagia circumcincta]
MKNRNKKASLKRKHNAKRSEKLEAEERLVEIEPTASGSEDDEEDSPNDTDKSPAKKKKRKNSVRISMKNRNKKASLKRKHNAKRSEKLEAEERLVEIEPTASGSEDDEEDSPNDTTEFEEEENMEVEGLASSSKDDDYQKEFKILGQTEFAPLKKVKFVPI